MKVKKLLLLLVLLAFSQPAFATVIFSPATVIFLPINLRVEVIPAGPTDILYDRISVAVSVNPSVDLDNAAFLVTSSKNVKFSSFNIPRNAVKIAKTEFKRYALDIIGTDSAERAKVRISVIAQHDGKPIEESRTLIVQMNDGHLVLLDDFDDGKPPILEDYTKKPMTILVEGIWQEQPGKKVKFEIQKANCTLLDKLISGFSAERRRWHSVTDVYYMAENSTFVIELPNTLVLKDKIRVRVCTEEPEGTKPHCYVSEEALAVPELPFYNINIPENQAQ